MSPVSQAALRCPMCSQGHFDGILRCERRPCGLHPRRLPLLRQNSGAWSGRVLCLIGLVFGVVGLGLLVAFFSAPLLVLVLGVAVSSLFLVLGAALVGVGLLLLVGRQTELRTDDTALLVLDIGGVCVGRHHYGGFHSVRLEAPPWPLQSPASQVLVAASPILPLDKLLRAEKHSQGPAADEERDNNAEALLQGALLSEWAQGQIQLVQAHEERYLGPWRWYTRPGECYWSPAAGAEPPSGVLSDDAPLEMQIRAMLARWQQQGRPGSGPLGLTLEDICQELFQNTSVASPAFTLAQQVRRHNPWMQRAGQRWMTRPEDSAERLQLQQRYADWLAAWTACQPELSQALERAAQKAILARQSGG